MLTATQAADTLGVSKRHLYQLAAAAAAVVLVHRMKEAA